jgi:hypothetical protein
VGSTRHELLSKTSAAAIDALDAAPSAAHIAATSATETSTADSSNAPANLASRHLQSHSITTPQHATRGVVSLLHPVERRHAHDERWSHVIPLVQAIRPSVRRAVKNLRIDHSAVLPLNNREVRGFHFCSTSAAM